MPLDNNASNDDRLKSRQGLPESKSNSEKVRNLFEIIEFGLTREDQQQVWDLIGGQLQSEFEKCARELGFEPSGTQLIDEAGAGLEFRPSSSLPISKIVAGVFFDLFPHPSGAFSAKTTLVVRSGSSGPDAALLLESKLLPLGIPHSPIEVHADYEDTFTVKASIELPNEGAAKDLFRRFLLSLKSS